MKAKFKEQTHAAVAAVFAASKNDVKPSYTPKTQKMDDDDIVSLPRLKEATVKAFREPFDLSSKAEKESSQNYSLPMPDSKHLDYLLVQIVKNIESNTLPFEPPNCYYKQESNRDTVKGEDPTDQGNSTKRSIATNWNILEKAKASKGTVRKRIEHNQLIFAGSLSSADKKPQDDGSDYFLGAASQELAGIAVGADSSRYQRGPCVPLVVTRFALGAILQADESVIKCLVDNSSGKSAKHGSSQNDHSSSPFGVEDTKEGPKYESAAASTAGQEGDLQTPEKIHARQHTSNNEPTWQYIKDDPTLRASLCTAMLQGGYPCSTSNGRFVNVSAELRLELNRNPALMPPIPFSCLSSPTPMTKCPFFSMEDAFGRIQRPR